MITTQETGMVRARIKNTLDRPTEFFLRAHISEGYVTLMREVLADIALQPGEVEQVAWEVTADDAAYGRLVLFKVTMRGGYPLPTRQGTCGILVVRAPLLTGNQVYALGAALSLVCLIAGGWLWIATNPHMLDTQVQVTRAMAVLAVSVLLGITVGLLGWWLPGGFFLILVLLTSGVVIGYLFNRAG
jgi:hypothetical protein